MEVLAFSHIFTRGVNQYDKEDVESRTIGTIMKASQVYGMFARGELGPSASSNNNIECEQHSDSTILPIHTAKQEGNVFALTSFIISQGLPIE